MRLRTISQFLLLVALTTAAECSFAQNVILGILEESKGHYFGDPNYRDVRVIFEKKGNAWEAFRSDCDDQSCLKSVVSTYPIETKWTITFDGRSVGQVVSRAQSEFRWYSDVGQQLIISTNEVPAVGARSAEFGGYTEGSVYRPLVANSQPYFADPDKWKPLALPAETRTVLQHAFRQKFPKLCRISPNDESTLKDFPYQNEDVAVAKAYASRLGLIVARLHLGAVDCQDTEAGFDIDDPWFLVDAARSVRYLDSGMWLVDAGDYDNDGQSEVIFSINRENEGGYEIWYDHFKKHSTFKFGYH